MSRTATTAERVAPWVVSALLAACTAWLFARFVPPFVDLPQHAHTLAILRDPAAWGDLFFVRLRPGATNALWFEVDRALLERLPVAASLGLACFLAVVALPLALAAWTRALGRDAGLAVLLGWWITWNRPLYWGFFHYALSLAAAVAALALDARRPGEDAARATRRSLGVAVMLCVVWTLHAQTWAFALAALLVQRVARSAPRDALGHAARAVPWMLPSVLLAVPWLLDALLAAPDDAALGLVAESPTRLQRPFKLLLHNAAAPLRWTTADDVLVGAVLALALAGLVAAARRAPLSTGARAAGAVGLLALAAYLLLPTHLHRQYYVAARMAPWLLIAAVPLACPPLDGAWRRATGLVYAVGAVATIGLHGTTLSRFDAESAPARRILAQIPGEQRVTLWAREQTSAMVYGRTYVHFASWYAAAQRGTTHFSFATFRPNPVGFTDATPRDEGDDEFRPWCLTLGGVDADFDYVITRGDTDPEAFCGALPHYLPFLDEVARDGEWALYRVTAPLPALAPCMDDVRVLDPARPTATLRSLTRAGRTSTRCPEALPPPP